MIKLNIAILAALSLFFAGCGISPSLDSLRLENERLQSENKNLRARLDERSDSTNSGPTVKSAKAWAGILRDKSMSEVKGVAGPPDRTWDADTQWVYFDKIIHPVTDKADDLYVNFDTTGRVKSFQAGSTGQKHNP